MTGERRRVGSQGPEHELGLGQVPRRAPDGREVHPIQSGRETVRGHVPHGAVIHNAKFTDVAMGGGNYSGMRTDVILVSELLEMYHS
jgi:hypothetical protein